MNKIKDKEYLNELYFLLKSYYTDNNIHIYNSKNSINNIINLDTKYISNNIHKTFYEHNKIYECNLPDIKCIIYTKKLTRNIINDIRLMMNRFYTMINFFKNNNIKYNQTKFEFNYIPTNFKKTLPKTIKTLGENEINSGMSLIYMNKIYLWRREENLKVFLHELFHCLGFDRFLIEKKCDLNKYFNLEHNLSCNEAYNELCTMIYHCCFLKIENRKFNLIKLIEKNRLFTMFQIKQILQYYNFKELNNNKLFRQNTSIFSYFILKGFYLFNFNKLIKIIKTDTFYFFPINNFEKFNNYYIDSIQNKKMYHLIRELINNFDFRKNYTLCMCYK